MEKKEYVSPQITVIGMISQVSLLEGSDLNSADAKVNHFGDEESEEDSNDPGSDPFWGKSAW